MVYKSGYILSTKGADVATYNPVPEPEIDNLRYCGYKQEKRSRAKGSQYTEGKYCHILKSLPVAIKACVMIVASGVNCLVQDTSKELWRKRNPNTSKYCRHITTKCRTIKSKVSHNDSKENIPRLKIPTKKHHRTPIRNRVLSPSIRRSRRVLDHTKSKLSSEQEKHKATSTYPL